MPGPYWDVRTCSWQGGPPPQAPPPVLLSARAADRVSPPVPAQPTADDVEPVEVVVPVT